MSREIEFRAYNKSTGVMLSNVPVAHGSAMTWRVAPKDSPVVTLEGKDGITNFYCDWDFLKEEPYLIVDQYAGRKDCEGLKIFENDIIVLTDDVFAVVAWNDETCSFCALYKDGSRSEHLYGVSMAKVIGNIHQNPELLQVNTCEK